MIFLLGARAHPIVRILIGAAATAVGLGLGFYVLAGSGIIMIAWGGYAWFRRLPR